MGLRRAVASPATVSGAWRLSRNWPGLSIKRRGDAAAVVAARASTRYSGPRWHPPTCRPLLSPDFRAARGAQTSASGLLWTAAIKSSSSTYVQCVAACDRLFGRWSIDYLIYEVLGRSRQPAEFCERHRWFLSVYADIGIKFIMPTSGLCRALLREAKQCGIRARDIGIIQRALRPPELIHRLRADRSQTQCRFGGRRRFN